MDEDDSIFEAGHPIRSYLRAEQFASQNRRQAAHFYGDSQVPLQQGDGTFPIEAEVWISSLCARRSAFKGGIGLFRNSPAEHHLSVSISIHALPPSLQNGFWAADVSRRTSSDRLDRDEVINPAMTLSQGPQKTRYEPPGRNHNPPQRSQYFSSS